MPRPPVDERLVAPGSRFEIIDGKVEYVPPCDEPHGSLHSKVAAVLEAHKAAGFDVAVDMLTRTSTSSDMAPDASVFPIERDPKTGGRQLEHLAFEVVSTERLSHAAKKAKRLAARGVRHVIALDIERRRALAWSVTTQMWEILPSDGSIEDAALAVPLPLRALLDAAQADDAIAAALVAKGHPVIATAVAAARAEGSARALLTVLRHRGINVPEDVSRHIAGEADAARLERWLERAATAHSLDEVLKD